jgi:hypothetical protein
LAQVELAERLYQMATEIKVLLAGTQLLEHTWRLMAAHAVRQAGARLMINLVHLVVVRVVQFSR